MHEAKLTEVQGEAGDNSAPSVTRRTNKEKATEAQS